MESLYNGTFNTNILFGILFIVAAGSVVYDLWLTRPIKGKFKGKIPLIVIAAIMASFGLFLLICGIVYAVQNAA